jgi:quercetin dioxygenase-like cupin family protein
MPTGKHNSSDDPARINGRGPEHDSGPDPTHDSGPGPTRDSGPDPTHDSGSDPTRDSGRDPEHDSGRGPTHGPARDPGAGEPDDVAMVEHLLAPGDPAPRTPPADHDRYAYVLEGQVAARIGAETLIAGPGSIVSIPRGCRHSLRSAGDTAAHVLVVHVHETEPGGPSERRAVA